jgi:SlyX protein
MVQLMQNSEEAIIELQTKLSFQEDLLENLNQVITDQQGQIAKLARTVESLLVQMHSIQSSMQDIGQKHEIPPHY